MYISIFIIFVKWFIIDNFRKYLFKVRRQHLSRKIVIHRNRAILPALYFLCVELFSLPNKHRYFASVGVRVRRNRL